MKRLDMRLSLLDRLEIWWTTAVVHRLERIGLLEPTCYCYYGAPPPDDDPRDFEPDTHPLSGACTPEEAARHGEACAAWARGERTGPRGFGLGTVLCEEHRRTAHRRVPPLLRARRRLLAWLAQRRLDLRDFRRWVTRRCGYSRLAGEDGPGTSMYLEWCSLRKGHAGDHEPTA